MSTAVRRVKPVRLVVIVPGFVALVAGLWAGLLLLGLDLPRLRPDFAVLHGPLLVCGFLGVVISIERAVALRRVWPYLAPIAAGVGAVLLAAGVPTRTGQVMFLISAVTLVAINILLLVRQTVAHHVVMTVGALSWAAGTALWVAGRTIWEIVPFLAGFLILTIVGERLELSRLVRPGAAMRAVFGGTVAVFAVGLVISTFSSVWGYRVAGIGLVAMVLWLMRYDIARFTIRRSGLTRYMAVAFILGYVWLGLAGVAWIASDGLTGFAASDIGLHGIFLGFVFSMIFAHAPMILPAVTGIRFPYRPVLYFPLLLLHLALVVRFIGALSNDTSVWRVGGTTAEIAIVVFIVVAVAVRIGVPRPGTAAARA